MKRPTARHLAIGAALSAVVVAATVNVTPSFAATGVSILSVNASDPHVWRCGDGTVSGICLTASQDMGSGQYDGNEYPMQNTNMWFLPDGSDPSVSTNWKPRNGTGSATIFSESTLINAGQVPSGAYHLWAPTTWAYNSKTYLFVPDVTNKSNAAPPAPGLHTSSKIFVADSTSRFGPFTYRRQLNLGTNRNGYQSDPSVYQELTQLWMVYADGDWGNTSNYPCGQISLTRLDSAVTGSVNPSRPGGVDHRVNIARLPSYLTNGCGAGNQAYIEGAELYAYPRTDGTRGFNYTLIFAAKAGSVPSECASRGNSSNELIGYATGTSLYSPNFEYRGIIMCGSDTSWTNQASITRFANGKPVIFYHDAPGRPWNRTVRAQCLDGILNPTTGVWDASKLPLTRTTNNTALSACAR